MNNKEKVKTEIVAAVEMLDELRVAVEEQETLNGDETKVVRMTLDDISQKFRLQEPIASVESMMVEKERVVGAINSLTTQLESRVDLINFR